MRPLRLLSRARRAVAVLGVLAVTGVAGCSGSSLDTDTTRDADGTIRIGLLLAQTGDYQPLGADMRRAWQLYLDDHGGRLGGFPVTTTVADEGTNQATALASAKKLLDADRADVLVGTASAEPTVAIAPLANKRKIPFVGTGGRPGTLTPDDLKYVWHTSWQSRETGAAIADHMKNSVDGPVWVMGPNYQGGWDQLGGFVDRFTKVGGVLANPGGKPAWTPWGNGEVNYLPYLNKIKGSGARAVYVFYAGKQAIAFVKQYRQAGINLPLFGAGFLTEGSTLTAQGAAADGIQTVSAYVPNLDNPANRAFATLYQKRYQQPPTLYAVTAWDSALMLDQAITAAAQGSSGGPAGCSSPAGPSAGTCPVPTGAAINAAIGRLGAIDSPRGSWRLGPVGHSPVQAWYLRKVAFDGRSRANVTVQTLTTLGS